MSLIRRRLFLAGQIECVNANIPQTVRGSDQALQLCRKLTRGLNQMKHDGSSVQNQALSAGPFLWRWLGGRADVG